MSKFLGKFRSEAEYSDDYEFAKQFLKNKKQRNSHIEVRKMKKHNKEDHYGSYEDYEWKTKHRK